MAPSVTLHDVAALAGVHYSIASRALDGQGNVAPATRERVLKAARDLGFVPNTQAGADEVPQDRGTARARQGPRAAA